MKTCPPSPTETTSVRLRLTVDEVKQLDTVRRFLGLPSLSATAARLALWNAKILASSLSSDSLPDVTADVVAEATRLATRKVLADVR